MFKGQESWLTYTVMKIQRKGRGKNKDIQNVNGVSSLVLVEICDLMFVKLEITPNYKQKL